MRERRHEVPQCVAKPRFCVARVGDTGKGGYDAPSFRGADNQDSTHCACEASRLASQFSPIFWPRQIDFRSLGLKELAFLSPDQISEVVIRPLSERHLVRP